jgi:hypothetical protein
MHPSQSHLAPYLALELDREEGLLQIRVHLPDKGRRISGGWMNGWLDGWTVY